MTTFVTDDRINAEKDGSFTINVEGGTITSSPPHIVDSGASVMIKDLTDKEIMDLWVKHLIDDIHVFARAVLKKANEK
jgi:hypothetical protein